MQTRKKRKFESDEDGLVSLKLFVFVYGKESITVWEKDSTPYVKSTWEKEKKLSEKMFDFESVKMSEKVSTFSHCDVIIRLSKLDFTFQDRFPCQSVSFLVILTS